ncbi:MAG: hypothetical protein M0P52_05055 [Rhodoferax sp.]|nr:hypothetical protein [Rhodoferax sp.]
MFVFQQFLQQLGGDVLVLEAAHFGEELVAQDADVRLGQTGGGEDVDDLALGGDGLAHELADGGIDLLGCFPVVAALFVQSGLQGLEKNSRRRGSPWPHRWRRRARRRARVPSPPAPSASCRRPVPGHAPARRG